MPTTRTAPQTDERSSPSAGTTVVLVWEAEHGSRADLNAFLRARRAEGWRVERREPRVVEGRAYGALIVLRRAEWASLDGSALLAPSERREPSAPPRRRASLPPLPSAASNAPDA